MGTKITGQTLGIMETTGQTMETKITTGLTLGTMGTTGKVLGTMGRTGHTSETMEAKGPTLGRTGIILNCLETGRLQEEVGERLEEHSPASADNGHDKQKFKKPKISNMKKG